MSGNHGEIRFNLLNGNSAIIVKKNTGKDQLGVVVVTVVIVTEFTRGKFFHHWWH